MSERFTDAWLLDQVEVVEWIDKEGEQGECWLWLGSHVNGVPRARDAAGNNVSLRRTLWLDRGGAIASGQAVGVSCEVPMCCKPSHLALAGRGDRPSDG
jgi:hypothetical protein